MLGGTAIGQSVGVAAFLAGLALGAASARTRADPRRAWGALEIAAAIAALSLPAVLDAVPSTAAPIAVALAAAPLGATWSAVAPRLSVEAAGTWYAANTAGAAIGVLVTAFVLLPALGVTGAERVLAGGAVALAAWLQAFAPLAPAVRAAPHAVAFGATTLAAVTGFSATGLEIAWFRWAAVGLGATVSTFAIVLAVFLVTVAGGAALGRRWPADPGRWLPVGLAALGGFALLGAAGWGLLPYGLGLSWQFGGEAALFPASVALVALAMGGAPAASGWVFATLLRLGGDAPRIYAANTLASIAAALATGVWLIPTLGLRGAVVVLALLPALFARHLRALLTVAALAALVPGWDARLYAVGIYLRISDFAEAGPRSIRRFADEGWDLRAYRHGQTAAVAVGESRTTGNRWLSINGKVDASTGDDMPTQVLSGQIPVALARGGDVVVVGLASGVTAGAALADSRVRTLTILEIEPAVVEASHWFDHVNARPLDDPRTTLVIDDARRWLARPGASVDVVISEPSNPWITGVSSLFTREYWEIGRRRLRPGGIFCQWVQLYGLGIEEFRAIVRTFLSVFPESSLYETIPGADVLLVSSALRGSVDPRLTPNQLHWLAGDGWLNTDDHPRVEWRAAAALHRATGATNAALIDAAAEQR